MLSYLGKEIVDALLSVADIFNIWQRNTINAQISHAIEMIDIEHMLSTFLSFIKVRRHLF